MRPSERARTIAGKYELEKLLGQGGMGEVWVANEISTGRKLALKLLKSTSGDSKENRARFEREAHIASTLVSPHIAQVTDSGVDEDDEPFMALELLHGEDLQKRIKNEGALPVAQVVRLAIQVGRALHVAHSAGLVHRDLKPANIFLARQGDEEIVKVLDFGIAKTGALDSTQYTAAGAMLGTASYMSPEQIRNAKTVDHRADLWAFAVVLFRALTGELPFPQQGFDLFLALAQDPIPVPLKVTSFVPGLPGPLNVFFERSFVRELDQRYPSASAMVVGFCRAAGVTVPADVLHGADGPAPSGPISAPPATPHPASREPAGLEGTMMLEPAPAYRPSTGGAPAAPAPAAGRPPATSFASTVLDPNEPDNAATLFYQPGAPDGRAPSSGAFGDGPAGPPFAPTFPLDAAREAAAGIPPARGPEPTLSDARPPHPSFAVETGGWQAVERPARPLRIWLLLVMAVVIAVAAGGAVFFLVGSDG